MRKELRDASLYLAVKFGSEVQRSAGRDLRSGHCIARARNSLMVESLAKQRRGLKVRGSFAIALTGGTGNANQACDYAHSPPVCAES